MKALKLGLVAVVGGLMLLAVACGANATADSDDAGGIDPANTEDVAAPIDELEVLIRESFPVQYAVRIVSGEPNGCHSFKESKIVERTGDTIKIAVTNEALVGDDVVCTMVYGMHESVVELGTGDDFTSGTEYTVEVNDKTVTFVAQ